MNFYFFVPFLAFAIALPCSIKPYQEFYFTDDDECPQKNSNYTGSLVFNNETAICFGYQGTCKTGKTGIKNNNGMRPTSPEHSETLYPSFLPSGSPTTAPLTSMPTLKPTNTPTTSPSQVPSSTPSSVPSNVPSETPSDLPTYIEFLIIPCNKTT